MLNFLNWIFFLPLALVANGATAFVIKWALALLWRKAPVGELVAASAANFIAAIVFVWAAGITVPSHKRLVTAILAGGAALLCATATYLAFQGGLVFNGIEYAASALGVAVGFRSYDNAHRRPITRPASSSAASEP